MYSSKSNDEPGHGSFDSCVSNADDIRNETCKCGVDENGSDSQSTGMKESNSVQDNQMYYRKHGSFESNKILMEKAIDLYNEQKHIRPSLAVETSSSGGTELNMTNPNNSADKIEDSRNSFRGVTDEQIQSSTSLKDVSHAPETQHAVEKPTEIVHSDNATLKQDVTKPINENKSSSLKCNMECDSGMYENEDGSYELNEWKIITYSRRKRNTERQTFQKKAKENVKRNLRSDSVQDKVEITEKTWKKGQKTWLERAMENKKLRATRLDDKCFNKNYPKKERIPWNSENRQFTRKPSGSNKIDSSALLADKIRVDTKCASRVNVKESESVVKEYNKQQNTSQQLLGSGDDTTGKLNESNEEKMEMVEESVYESNNVVEQQNSSVTKTYAEKLRENCTNEKCLPQLSEKTKSWKAINCEGIKRKLCSEEYPALLSEPLRNKTEEERYKIRRTSWHGNCTENSKIDREMPLPNKGSSSRGNVKGDRQFKGNGKHRSKKPFEKVIDQKGRMIKSDQEIEKVLKCAKNNENQNASYNMISNEEYPNSRQKQESPIEISTLLSSETHNSPVRRIPEKASECPQISSSSSLPHSYSPLRVLPQRSFLSSSETHLPPTATGKMGTFEDIKGTFPKHFHSKNPLADKEILGEEKRSPTSAVSEYEGKMDKSSSTHQKLTEEMPLYNSNKARNSQMNRTDSQIHLRRDLGTDGFCEDSSRLIKQIDSFNNYKKKDSLSFFVPNTEHPKEVDGEKKGIYESQTQIQRNINNEQNRKINRSSENALPGNSSKEPLACSVQVNSPLLDNLCSEEKIVSLEYSTSSNLYDSFRNVDSVEPEDKVNIRSRSPPLSSSVTDNSSQRPPAFTENKSRNPFKKLKSDFIENTVQSLSTERSKSPSQDQDPSNCKNKDKRIHIKESENNSDTKNTVCHWNREESESHVSDFHQNDTTSEQIQDNKTISGQYETNIATIPNAVKNINSNHEEPEKHTLSFQQTPTASKQCQKVKEIVDKPEATVTTSEPQNDGGAVQQQHFDELNMDWDQTNHGNTLYSQQTATMAVRHRKRMEKECEKYMDFCNANESVCVIQQDYMNNQYIQNLSLPTYCGYFVDAPVVEQYICYNCGLSEFLPVQETFTPITQNKSPRIVLRDQYPRICIRCALTQYAILIE